MWPTLREPVALSFCRLRQAGAPMRNHTGAADSPNASRGRRSGSGPIPEKDDGSDVADWLPGHTMDELWALVDASEVVKPSGPSAETSSNGTTGHLGVMTSEEFMSKYRRPRAI